MSQQTSTKHSIEEFTEVLTEESQMEMLAGLSQRTNKIWSQPSNILNDNLFTESNSENYPFNDMDFKDLLEKLHGAENPNIAKIY